MGFKAIIPTLMHRNSAVKAKSSTMLEFVSQKKRANKKFATFKVVFFLVLVYLFKTSFHHVLDPYYINNLFFLT